MSHEKSKNIEAQDEVQEFKHTEISEEDINIDDIIISSPVSAERTKIAENKFLSRGMKQNPIEHSCNKPLNHQCCKLDAVNWLADVKNPNEHLDFQIVEVRFKNNRKDFFRLPEEGTYEEGDVVAVEASPGHDIGIISLMG